MTSGWDAFSTRRLWPLATLSTVQNMGGMQKKDVVFWSEQHVFVSPSKHHPVFHAVFPRLGGIKWYPVCLSPTHAISLANSQVPSTSEAARSQCPANDPQVPGSSSTCVADSEIPCKQITDFQLRSVYYTLSLSSSFTHVHPVSSSLIIIPYHELSPIFVHLLFYDQMIPNDGTCKSIQIQPSKCHSPGSPVSCWNMSEACHLHIDLFKTWNPPRHSPWKHATTGPRKNTGNSTLKLVGCRIKALNLARKKLAKSFWIHSWARAKQNKPKASCWWFKLSHFWWVPLCFWVGGGTQLSQNQTVDASNPPSKPLDVI